MNYLELVNKVVRRCGIGGAHQNLTSIENQTGRLQLAVDWIAEADMEIQQTWDDWTFHNKATDVVVDGEYIDESTDGYPANLARIIPTAVYGRVGNQRGKLTQCPWPVFRDKQATQTLTVAQGIPSIFAIDPSGRFYFDHISSEAWILHLEYYTQPVVLTGSSQVPIIPEQFHDAIVFGAAVKYAMYEEAPNLMQTYQMEHGKYMAALQAACLTDQSRTNISSSEDPVVISAV